MADPSRDPAVLCIGTSHHTASLAARERFALDSPRGKELRRQLVLREDVDELVAIATCNRSELYLVTTDREGVIDATISALAELANVDAEELATVVTVYDGAVAAADHLFRTAGGIESVVTGEAQIQGQLRGAHEAAREDRTCGPILDQLFRRAVQVGKRARTETRIGEGRASVGSVAAELVAGHHGGDIADARMVVVGAGKMGALAARSLADRGATRIDVANRSVERASAVLEQSGVSGVGVAFERIDQELAECDVLVSCTNAPHVLFTRERIERAMEARGGRALVLVDLAVPRDIDPSCGSIDGVHAFDLDDLERIVAQTMDVRSEEVAAVDALARDAATQFAAWLRGERATPQIRAMRERAETRLREELDDLMQQHATLTSEQRMHIEQLTRRIVNGVLHEQTVRLRQAAELS